MKTVTRYKSLLLAGGLLLICLAGLHLSQPQHHDSFKAVKTERVIAKAKCDAVPEGGSYLKDIAGVLFPVLKSLKPM
jgi:hypothetical protein